MSNTSTGSVQWFNETKCFGFIQANLGEDLFAHFSEIQSSGFKLFNEGQRVSFVPGQRKKGPQATFIKASNLSKIKVHINVGFLFSFYLGAVNI